MNGTPIVDVVHIHAASLQRNIDRLASVGTTRLAYSDADKAGRLLTIEMMKEVGLRVRVDSAGNIFGRREGKRNLPVIMFGSHIDTVPEAGRFDGVLGVMAAIECIRAVEESGRATAHPLEVAIFANEEGQNYGALCGSRAVVGDINEESLSLAGRDGRTMGEAIRFIGGEPENIHSSIRQAGEIHAYLELHIEQGGELERLGLSIGVVEGISGIQYVDVHVQGVPNHAGTTAMELRRDALVAASRLVLAVNQAASSEHLCRVATVGSVIISPNSANIIPGSADLIVEVRDLSEERLSQTLQHLQHQADTIAQDTGATFEFKERKLVPPIPAHAAVLAAVERASKTLGFAYHRMPSGAGHDAQIIARMAPMGMIFVPSIGGVSHSPDEFTRAEDCARGADVLLGTILQLDTIEHLA